MIDISIIIPSYNNLSTIGNCLDSIFSQQTKYNYEVILVNSSDKDDYSVLAPKFPELKMIKLNQRTYPGTARNIGVKAAKGKLIAFTDSDCIVFPDWINSTVDEHKKRDEILIGGAVANGTPHNLVGIAEYVLEFSDFIPQKNVRSMRVVASCNLSISKKLFLQAGGFEDFITNEDVLFSSVLNEKGVNICFVPNIKIYHVNRCNLWKFLKNQENLGYGSYKIRKIKKQPGSFLTKSRLLIPLIIPIRILTTFRKISRGKANCLLQFFVSFPIILAGIIFYSKGFFKGFTK